MANKLNKTLILHRLMQMTTTRIFVLIFLLYVAGFLAHALFLNKTVYGDGIYYFAWLRSVIVDGDIDFANEYQLFGVQQPQTARGLIRNIYSIGPALLWAPLYTFSHIVIRGKGFEFPYQLATGLSGVFYVFTGIILIYRLLRNFFTERVSLYAILGIAVGTHLYFYGALDTVNSHAYTFFAASLFLSLLFATSKNWWAIGASLGLIGLIRMQDLIYATLLLPFVNIKNGIKVLVSALVVMLPQFIIWQLFHGNFLQSTYFAEGKLYFRPMEPNIAEVLFAPLNGLFLWTPLLVLATVGLMSLSLKWRYINLLFPLLFLLHTYVISIRNEWWQEASFSGRMYVSLLPIFAFGLACTFDWMEQKAKLLIPIILGIVIPLNAILIIFYLLMH